MISNFLESVGTSAVNRNVTRGLGVKGFFQQEFFHLFTVGVFQPCFGNDLGRWNSDGWDAGTATPVGRWNSDSKRGKMQRN